MVDLFPIIPNSYINSFVFRLSFQPKVIYYERYFIIIIIIIIILPYCF